MGLLNAIGSWFQKLSDGWVFGSQLYKLIFRKNAEIVGTDDMLYEYQFQEKSGTVAHLDDIPDLNATFVSTVDYTTVKFDKLGGYIIGTPEVPLSNLQLSLDFTGSKQFSQVMIYHQSGSVPTFDGLDTPNDVKVIGTYVTSVVNRIAIFHEGNGNIVIGFLNDVAPIQDGLVKAGTVTIVTETSADVNGFEWRLGGVLFLSGSITNIAINPLPTTYDRVDLLVGDSNGNVIYIAGEEAEDQPTPIIPNNTVVLSTLYRNITGTVVEIGSLDLSDFVRKSLTSLQTLQGLLAFNSTAAANAIPARIAVFSRNGLLYPGKTVLAGVHSTKEFVGGYSPIVKINTSSNQIRYSTCIEFSGISTPFEKGTLWIQFITDVSGNLTANHLKVFGEINPAKFVMVKVSALEYIVYVHHDEPASFFKFRPQIEFGASAVYEYYHQADEVDPLPSGDQYSFSVYGGAGSSNTDNEVMTIFINPLDLSGTGTLAQQVCDYVNANVAIDYNKNYSKLNFALGVDPSIPFPSAITLGDGIAAEGIAMYGPGPQEWIAIPWFETAEVIPNFATDYELYLSFGEPILTAVVPDGTPFGTERLQGFINSSTWYASGGPTGDTVNESLVQSIATNFPYTPASGTWLPVRIRFRHKVTGITSLYYYGTMAISYN